MFVLVLVEFCAHLVIAQRKVGLLLQIQGGGNSGPQGDGDLL